MKTLFYNTVGMLESCHDTIDGTQLMVGWLVGWLVIPVRGRTRAYARASLRAREASCETV
jgi:hypothetical protein